MIYWCVTFNRAESLTQAFWPVFFVIFLSLSTNRPNKSKGRVRPSCVVTELLFLALMDGTFFSLFFLREKSIYMCVSCVCVSVYVWVSVYRKRSFASDECRWGEGRVWFRGGSRDRRKRAKKYRPAVPQTTALQREREMDEL